VSGDKVKLTHEDLGEALFDPDTVPFWQTRGWTPADPGAPAEQVTRDTAGNMDSVSEPTPNEEP